MRRKVSRPSVSPRYAEKRQPIPKTFYDQIKQIVIDKMIVSLPGRHGPRAKAKSERRNRARLWRPTVEGKWVTHRCPGGCPVGARIVPACRPPGGTRARPSI